MAEAKIRPTFTRRSVLQGAGAVGGTAALGALLAACSGQSGSSSTGGELRLWQWEPTQKDYFDKVIKEYEASHKGVKITQRYMPYAAYNTALQAALAAKSEPDIFFPGVSLIALGQANRVLDLKKELGESFVSQFYPSDNQMTQYKDAQYGVAWQSQITLGYYNKKMFADAGVQPPETWDDLIKIAPTLSKSAGVPVATMQGNPNNTIADFLLPLVTQAADDPTEVLKLDFLEEKGLTWNTPHVVEAFQKLIDLIDAKVFDPGLLSVDQDSSYAAYYGRKAAILFSGSWALPSIVQSATKDFMDNEFGLLKMPAWKSGARHWTGDQAGDVFSVSSRTQNKKLALDFLQYLYEPTRYSTFMNAVGNMPSTIAAGKLVKEPNLAELQSWLANGDGAPHILFGQGSFTAVANTAAGVFQGKYTASQAAAAVQSAVMQARR